MSTKNFDKNEYVRKFGIDIGRSVVERKTTKTEKIANTYAGELAEWVRADLARSGLNEETIEEMKIFSGKSPDRCDMLKEVLGFASQEGQSLAQATDVYCIPYLQSEGFCRVKLQIAVNGAKYLSPVANHYNLWHLYFLLKEKEKFSRPYIPLIVTEGEKKAARLTQEIRARKIEALAVGFAGVSMWEHVLEWKYLQLAGRHVYIAFDSDFATKRPVQLEIAKLALWLYQKKATPRLLAWPEENGKGVDDFLQGGGDLDAIMERGRQANLAELLKAMHMITLQDVTAYAAKYRFTKSAFKALYESYRLDSLYQIKKSTATELFVREIKIISEQSQPEIDQEQRPVIRIENGQLPTAVDEAERLLADGQSGVYQRGGALVRIVPTSSHCVPKIIPVESVYLKDLLTRIAAWQKYDTKKYESEPIDCPKDIADTLLSRAMWRIPELTRIITAPTIRQDGSILDQPGYDEETGLYLSMQIEFPPVNQDADLNEALAALDMIRELLKGFPFVSKDGQSVSFSVMLAALLTGMVRPCLRTSPMFCFTAPKPGSGKSLLADIIAMVVTGSSASVMSQADKPDEEKKRVLSVLGEGDQVLCIDNVEKPLGGDTLCSIITQERWKDRLLNFNKTVTVDTKITVLATGNNIVLQGDLITRALVCYLDAKTDHPEERKFDVNMYQHVPEYRGILVKALLTILKAYYNSGKPNMDLTQYGRFEEWSSLIRSSIVWLGLPDPCLSRASLEDRDPIGSALRQLLVAWHSEFNNLPTTLNQAVNRAITLKGQGHDSLFEALYEISGERDSINVRRLGKLMKSFEERVETIIVNDDPVQYRITSKGKDRTQKTLWAVEVKGNHLDDAASFDTESFA